VPSDQWDAQLAAFGAFIRSQRKLANLTLRQLAELTSLSNPYLSELERGMHQPSVRVLRQLSNALNLSGEILLTEAGLLDPDRDADAFEQPAVERAIRADPTLDESQKAALLAVYQSMTARRPEARATGHPEGPPTQETTRGAQRPPV
jgi:transcriptional regulator with XRE-family HTH domain